jgi:hypothetical protein
MGPLPPRRPHDTRAHVGRHAHPPAHLHEAVQQTPPTPRMSVRRPLQLDLDPGRGALLECARVRPPEPCQGRVLQAGRRLALDQDQRPTGTRSSPSGRSRRPACEPRAFPRR